MEPAIVDWGAFSTSNRGGSAEEEGHELSLITSPVAVNGDASGITTPTDGLKHLYLEPRFDLPPMRSREPESKCNLVQWIDAWNRELCWPA